MTTSSNDGLASGVLQYYEPMDTNTTDPMSNPVEPSADVTSKPPPKTGWQSRNRTWLIIVGLGGLAAAGLLWSACAGSSSKNRDTSGQPGNSNQQSTATRLLTVSLLAASNTCSNCGKVAFDSDLNTASSLAADANGNLYVAVGQQSIKKITPDLAISTYVGQEQRQGRCVNTSAFGFSDGRDASFCDPGAISFDSSGNLYIADMNESRIRKVTPDGITSTVAGGDRSGTADGPRAQARFNFPSGIAVDSAGTVYVWDKGRLRKIATDGTVSTVAASGTPGLATCTDGQGKAVGFGGNSDVDLDTTGIAVDSAGNVYIPDYACNAIRKVSPAGAVTTLAGSQKGFADGQGRAAKFNGPSSVALDASGNLLVADSGNRRIRQISPAGVVTTIAGSGLDGDRTGPALQAEFNGPRSVAADAAGNIYVIDSGIINVKKIAPQR